MTTEQFRLAIVAILVLLIGLGIYAGWQATHHAHRPCYGSLGQCAMSG